VIEAGVRVEPIPGPSAVTAALVASGLAGDTFTFLGFPPTRSTARTRWFAELSLAGRTVVFFEAPHRILRTLGELQEHVGDVPVALAREVTKKHEELVRGPISEVVRRLGRPLGEFTVVVSIGQTTDLGTPDLPPAETMRAEIGRMTDCMGVSRRRAIAEIARKHGRSANEVYTAIEQAKKSTK
jgi:16S rRNA (cytidine1402-2'-O)-methyltransferase